jgi:hypothetical protein
LETVPYEKMGDLPSLNVVNYRSTGRTSIPPSGMPKFQKEAGGPRVAAALQQLAAWDPARLSGVAAVSYNVTVRFQEEPDLPRPVWSPHLQRPHPIDHVVPGVDLT